MYSHMSSKLLLLTGLPTQSPMSRQLEHSKCFNVYFCATFIFGSSPCCRCFAEHVVTTRQNDSWSDGPYCTASTFLCIGPNWFTPTMVSIVIFKWPQHFYHPLKGWTSVHIMNVTFASKLPVEQRHRQDSTIQQSGFVSVGTCSYSCFTWLGQWPWAQPLSHGLRHWHNSSCLDRSPGWDHHSWDCDI